MTREEQELRVRLILEAIEGLAATLADGVQGDRRLHNWAANVEMTAREFKVVPLAGREARWQPPLIAQMGGAA